MRASTRKKVRSFLEAFVRLLDTSRIPGEDARAVCYTCKNQIRQSQLLYYAPPIDKDYWCALCGTKIRIENGSHQCAFFHGLKPGEID